MTISAFYGLLGLGTTWREHLVLPGGQDPVGSDILPAHARAVKADLVITLMDIWTLDAARLREMRAECAVAHWVPVDCAPLGVKDAESLATSGATPIAMSQFGKRMLDEAGIPDARYVPHGIDTQMFAPPQDREAVRRSFGLDGKWVIGICAANKDGWRKGFPEQFAAFAQFRRKHPEAVLLVHSLVSAPGALDLSALAARLGISDAVRFSDQYSILAGLIGPAQLVMWYGICDVVSNCSYGEGFGLPVLEAQSCGTPAVVTNCSSMTELCGSGWKVGGEQWWNPVHQSWWVKPSIPGIVRAYERAYAATRATGPGGLPPCRVKAREFAMRYDADRLLGEYWDPVLRELAGTVPAAQEPAAVAP